MATQTKFAATALSVPGEGEAWVDAGNAVGENDSTYASCNLASGARSAQLRLTNFGFTLPVGATIVSAIWRFWGNVQRTDMTNTTGLVYNGVAESTGHPIWDDDACPDPPGEIAVESGKQEGSGLTLDGILVTIAQWNASTMGVELSFSNGHALTSLMKVNAFAITLDYTPPSSRLGLDSIAYTRCPPRIALIGGGKSSR